MLFPLFIMLTYATNSRAATSVSGVCLLMTTLAIVVLSIIGYIIVTLECSEPTVSDFLGERFCGPRCLYNIHDITNTTYSDIEDKNHVTYDLFTVFVPIMWGLSLIVGCGGPFILSAIYSSKLDVRLELDETLKQEDRERKTKKWLMFRKQKKFRKKKKGGEEYQQLQSEDEDPTISGDEFEDQDSNAGNFFSNFISRDGALTKED